MFTLVVDWREIALRSDSMWAFYLSLLALLIPDILYVAGGWQTNPRFWFWLAFGLIVYGIVFRLRDQGIASKTK